MLLGNLKKVSPWLRIITAIPIVVIAAAVRLNFLQELGTTAPFITFYPAVAIAASYGGVPAGLLATALSILTADYFLIGVIGELGITQPVDLLGTYVFMASCLLISGASWTIQHFRERANAAEERELLAAERERSAIKIAENEKKYRALFENMQVGLAYCRIIVDDRGTPVDFAYLDVNSKFVELTGVQNVVGRNVTEVFPGIKEAHPELFEVYGRVASTGMPEQLEIEFKPLGLWFSISVYCPEKECFIAVVDDITMSKRSQEEIDRLNTELYNRAAELEVANLELESFNYTVAHDLRRPLTLISSYCEIIKELYGDKLDEKCINYLQEAYHGAWQMNQIIDSLLELSRVMRAELHRESVDLSAIVHEIASELKLAEPGRKVSFMIVSGVSAECDKGLIRVALDNLLSNAFKYTSMREEALIEFGTKQIDGNPVCFIRDNGAGFDMADADRLFIPFTRLDGAEKHKGFGIGLATVVRIISRHGGRIWAEGELGKGATFYFTLNGGRTN